MNLFSERLQKLVDKTGLSQKDIAAKLGFSPASIHNYLAGRIPKTDQLSQIAAYFNVSTDFLLGKDDIKLPEPEKAPLPRNHGGPYWGTSCTCPVISWVSAGQQHAYEDQGDEGPRVATDCKDANCYAVCVEGDSMVPVYLEGDIIVVEPNSEARQGDLVIAKTTDDEVYFKKLAFSKDQKTIRLQSFNPNYPVMEFKREDVQFLHPIFSVTRYRRKIF